MSVSCEEESQELPVGKHHRHCCSVQMVDPSDAVV